MHCECSQLVLAWCGASTEISPMQLDRLLEECRASRLRSRRSEDHAGYRLRHATSSTPWTHLAWGKQRGCVAGLLLSRVLLLAASAAFPASRSLPFRQRFRFPPDRAARIALQAPSGMDERPQSSASSSAASAPTLPLAPRALKAGCALRHDPSFFSSPTHNPLLLALILSVSRRISGLSGAS